MTRKDPLPKKLVVVVWEDIVAHAGWTGTISESIDEVAPITCVSVGWIIEKTEERLLIADSFTRDHNCGGVSALPMSVVTDIVVLDTGTNTTPLEFMKKKRTPPRKEKS